MKIRKGVADKIKPSHMIEILHRIKNIKQPGCCLYFTKEELEFEINLTAYGDIVISIKHTRL